MYPKKQLNIAHPWLGFIEPFRILKGISFIGTYQASVHMIDTGDGLVILDTGYLKTFYTVVNGIYQLGYTPKDIKYVLLTHWHGDHTEGVMPLLSLAPNAKTVIGIRDDREVIQRNYFNPDIVVKDGDTLTCGKVTFRFVETPGHTVGTVSVFFDYEQDGRIYHAGMFGGAGPAALFADHANYYEGCRDDYFASLQRLKQEKVDLFLGNHCWNNNTDEKAKLLKENPSVNPFVDDREFYTFLDFCAARVRARMRKEHLDK